MIRASGSLVVLLGLLAFLAGLAAAGSLALAPTAPVAGSLVIPVVLVDPGGLLRGAY